MNGNRVFISTILMILGLAGCAKKPSAFRLAAPGNVATLIPPDARDASVIRATVRIAPVARKAVCPPSPRGLTIQKSQVIVTRAAMDATTGPELFAWTVGLEKQGCLPPNQAFQTAEK